MAALIQKQQINVVGVKSDKADQLLGYIVENPLLEEALLVKKIFPNNANEQHNYNRLKRSLRQRLVNTLFASDPRQKNYWELYFDVGKKDLVCNFLWNKEKGRAAAEMANEALKVAMKYHFTDFSCSLSRRLSNHYAVIVSDPIKFREYQTINQLYGDKLKWEQKAENCYYDLAFHLRTTKAIDTALIEKTEIYIKDLGAASDNISWTFEFIRVLIVVILSKMKNDGQGVIEICEKALKYFESLPFQLPNRPIRSINFHLIPAFVQSKQYTLAQATIQKVKSLIPKTGYNWIAIHQYEAIVGFHTNDFNQSASAIKEIKKSKLASRIREEVRIYETYHSFFSGEPIRMTTFLNDTPKFSLDKKGMNINRVVLQVLVLLSKNDRAGIIDRAESLEKYAYRYLTKDETVKRSQIFFRLLFLMVKSAFDPKEIEKRTAKTFLELQQTPRHLSTIDIEVLPYELLWERVKQILG
ncbi:MAG: hypothetical protein R2828_35645 [Saprospiraceae bacterium]